MKQKMEPNDILFLYFAAHGGNLSGGTETTKTKGDEYINIGNVACTWPLDKQKILTDDDLYSMLKNSDGIKKWVVIDACDSGGFWGNNNINDEGDLEKLKNIALLAASPEGENTFYSSDEIPPLAYALEWAFSLDIDGLPRADINKDGNVTIEEIYASAMLFLKKFGKDINDNIVYRTAF